MRLIDADAFVEAIKGVEVSWYLDGNYETYDDSTIMDIIEEQPTVEAVPVQALTDAILDKTKVVRCKDCKHIDLPAVLTRKYGKIGTLTCHNRYSPCNNRNVNEKDFCSHGEMRTSAE